MTDTYILNSTIQVRTGTISEWEYSAELGKGALRILAKGEIGWVQSTSLFKIGDGVNEFRNLPWIEPKSPLAQYLGTEDAKFSYDDIVSALNDLDSKITDLSNTVTAKSTKYYDSYLNFPPIGELGPLYVDGSTGDIYYWNDNGSLASIGYRKLTNSFDIIECRL